MDEWAIRRMATGQAFRGLVMALAPSEIERDISAGVRLHNERAETRAKLTKARRYTGWLRACLFRSSRGFEQHSVQIRLHAIDRA
jgi:hypothetical protein